MPPLRGEPGWFQMLLEAGETIVDMGWERVEGGSSLGESGGRGGRVAGVGWIVWLKPPASETVAGGV